MSTFKELQEKYPDIKAKSKIEMLEAIEELQTPKQAKRVNFLRLNADDANKFMEIIRLVLVGDDRLKPLQTHFIEMIKLNNEENSKQPAK